MGPDQLLSELLDNNVLTSTGSGLRSSEQYTNSNCNIKVENLNLQSKKVEEALQYLNEQEPELLSRYITIQQNTNLTSEQSLKSLLVIEQLFADNADIDDIPDGFIPVQKDHLKICIDIFENVILYAWKYDCSQCDQMEIEFEQIDFSTKDVFPLAVYGPDCPRLLEKEYEIYGAPTTLFIYQNQIESRMQGSYPQQAIKRELSRLNG